MADAIAENKELQAKHPDFIERLTAKGSDKDAETITFEEIRELATLVTGFLEAGDVQKHFADTGIFNGTSSFLNMTIHLPKILLENDAALKEFEKIMLFVTGVNPEAVTGQEKVKLMIDTLSFLEKTNILPFFLKITTTLKGLISG